jgi:hypothetical protein
VRDQGSTPTRAVATGSMRGVGQAMNETSECSKRVEQQQHRGFGESRVRSGWGAGADSVHIGAQLATRNGPGAVVEKGQTFLSLVTPAGATAIREHGSSGASARHGDEDSRPLQGNGPLSELPVVAATCRSLRQKACVCPRPLLIRHTASAAVSSAARALRSRERAQSAWCLCELTLERVTGSDGRAARKRGQHDWAFATTMDCLGRCHGKIERQFSRSER